MRNRGLREFWTTDSETDPFHHCNRGDCLKCAGVGRIPKPFIWGATNGNDYVEFDTGEQLAEFFRGRRTIVYAHNGGRFDYHYLREYINSDENIMVISGRLAKFKIGECEFRDSLNIFQQTALAQFGGKFDIDYEKMEPDRRIDPNIFNEIKLYLRQDCVLLWEKLQQYFTKYGCGLTQAGAAMRLWANMAKVEPPRQTPEQFRRYKPFYYGGRVEYFKQEVRTQAFNVVDINSAYPRAMLEKHPFSTSAEVTDTLPDDKDIERTLIRLRCKSDGAFPYRKDTGELTFPNDGELREYFVTGWEYLAALDFNALRHIEIVEVHRFGLSIDFTEYVERFYKERQHAKAIGDKAENIFCKLFLNSLYGKFGSNPGGIHSENPDDDNPMDGYQEYVIAQDESLSRWKAQGYEASKPWGERYLMSRPLPEVKHRYFNVATAASITGWVRAYLYRSMRACQDLIYCDTDSLVARDTSRLPLGDSLGKWKLELQCNRYAIAGKKLYAFEAEDATYRDGYGLHDRKPKTGPWKIASKGARLTPHEIIRIADGETIQYLPESPTYSLMRPEPRFINRQIHAFPLAN